MAYPDPVNPDLSLADLIHFKNAYKRKLKEDLEPVVRASCIENLALVEKYISDLDKAAHSGQVIRIL
ncbi:MAG: hypothetical protein PHH09_04615 [Methanoregulaceae archaeon]|nr:hypothetical protein [Methanoregulaceae archaeon]